MITGSTLNNLVFAQIQPFQSAPPTDQQLEKIGVKIISPLSGQKIPIAHPPVINGISTDNVEENCQVSVIVNNVKPYQKAEATGKGGSSDYSSWIFHVESNYTMLKEGQNKITAKLVCLSSQANLTKWYSVNITGLAA